MRGIIFFSAFLLMVSCATEKPNGSPVGAALTQENKSHHNTATENSFNFNIKKNINAAEITNLVSSFPRFSNSRLNSEVTILKYSLQNYLYAIDANNIEGKKKSLKKVEKSYKDIQKLRRFLNYHDNEVINRYLVRIKTNIAVIEDTLSSKKINY